MAPSDFYIPVFLPPPCGCVYVGICASVCLHAFVLCASMCEGGVLSECLHVSTCVYMCVQACIVGIFIMYLFIDLAMLGLNCGTWDLVL